MSILTKEGIQKILNDDWLLMDECEGLENCTVIKELARMALAAMDSEPVEMPLDYLQGHKDGLEWAARLAEANHPDTGDWLYDDPIELAKAIRKGPDMPPAQPAADSEPDRNPVLAYADSYRDMAKQGVESVPIWSVITDIERNIAPLYRHAQPVPERDQVRSEHAEWSQATFGNVGPIGPLKHLSKEALEAAAEPGDLSEWADMQFLLWDAQRRAGITDEQITQAMIDKLAVNKQRSWPEPKDGEPRLHIKEQPAPVVPVVPVVPATLPCSVELKPGLIIGKGCKTETLLTALRRRADYNADIDAMTPEERAEHDASIKAFKAMLTAAPQLPGSEPATVPGKWIPVSERMPEVGVKVLCFPVEDEPIHATFNGQLWLQDVSWSGSDEPIDNVIPTSVTHWMPLPAGPQEVR